MISGGAAEREDREDEAESDKPNRTQPALDMIERALSSALSPMHASDKGEEAPGSLRETRSPSKDKNVSSQQEGTNSLRVIMMHSTTESTVIIHEADKIGGTQLSLEERAEDKSEDEDKI